MLAWGENLIRVRLPKDLSSGESTAIVTVAERESNTLGFTVKDPLIAPRIFEIPCHQDSLVCSVYLPSQYDREPSRRFPTIYQFQGRSWTNRTLPMYSNIAAVAEDFGFILVFDWPLTTKEEALVLVKETDSAYRTIPSAGARGLWLISASGGLGLQLASEQPEVFGAVDANAACVGEFDPAGARRLRLRLDIGDDDSTCGPATQRVHEQLSALGIVHEYDRYPGRHNTGTIFADATIRRVLNFFAQALH